MSEENNIIKVKGATMIFNGGNPLKDCPVDWDEAKKVQDQMNKGKREYEEPIWEWDCGFKLDFDGPIIKASSRFYPPKTHQGSSWDGDVTISILGEKFEEKKFDCESLEELNKQVEEYVKRFVSRVKSLLQNDKAVKKQV